MLRKIWFLVHFLPLKSGKIKKLSTIALNHFNPFTVLRFRRFFRSFSFPLYPLAFGRFGNGFFACFFVVFLVGFFCRFFRRILADFSDVFLFFRGLFRTVFSPLFLKLCRAKHSFFSGLFFFFLFSCSAGNRGFFSGGKSANNFLMALPLFDF